jgi:repressor LexA
MRADGELPQQTHLIEQISMITLGCSLRAAFGKDFFWFVFLIFQKNEHLRRNYSNTSANIPPLDGVQTFTYTPDMPKTAASLTNHQRTVLNYIKEFQSKRGYSPSLADLAIAFGVRSKNAIAKVVNVLAREGFIEKDPKGRIKILSKEKKGEPPKPMTLPLFGPIAAGFAAPVEEQAEEKIAITDFLVRDPSRTFLLRVKGDSMIDAGILEGDLVIVERGANPKVGDIVVGILDGEFTLKRLAKDKGKYYLHAENPEYPDLYAMEELQVAGVVRSVIRKV